MMKFKDVSRLDFEFKTLAAGLQGIALFRVSAMLLSIAYLSYVVFFVVMTGEAEAEQNLPSQSSMSEAPETAIDIPAPDFLQIADWHLFGQAPNNDQTDPTVSQTQLQLKLLGVFLLSRTSEYAYAIIQTEDGQQKKYRPGEDLPGGATLKTIERSRVVLLHDNRQEFLALQTNGAVPHAITE